MASVGNPGTSTGPPAAGPRSAFNGTPVAHEAPVVATGARPGGNSGKRALFTESTTTALVFPNGGVIRLSVPVERGQLLFLTNQQTKREVVTQVTRRRDNSPTGYYVELEFTEPAAAFWGITFPEDPEAVPANLPQPAAAILFESPEPTEEHVPNAPAPTAAEVAALMEEVEALRAQLRTMQTQTAPPSPTPVAAANSPSACGAPTREDSAAPSLLPVLRLSALVPAPLTPVPQHAEAPPQREKSAPRPNDDLLPKPALDFHQARSPQGRPVSTSHSAPSDRVSILRLALLAVVSLFAVTIAARNMHWLPWLSRSVTISSGKAASVGSVNKPPSPTPPAVPQNSTAQPDAAASSPTAVPVSKTGAASAAISAQLFGAAAPPPPSSTLEEHASSTHATPSPERTHDAAPAVSVSKRSALPASPDRARYLASIPETDAAIVPPRLIKSVRAVAPGNALRSFVTGNVTLDALIDKSGHVATMKVLSGPASFHKAAMNALKQYRYEPARQNGQPVAAHITVTVPFWFEP